MSPGGAGQNNSRDKAVVQIDPNTFQIVKKYKNITSASSYFNESNCSNLCACCNKKQNTFHGFYWCYEKDYKEWKPPVRKSNKKPIYQLDPQTLEVIKE